MRKIESLIQFKSKKAGIAVLLVMYGIMGLGYISALSTWFVFLTPIMLFITAGMIWVDSKTNNKLGWPIAIVVILAGYLIEIAGVHFPKIFGSYQYGEMLGWKFFETPPIIGIEWLIIVWGSVAMATPFQVHPFLKWLFAALIGTGLFWAIEPVARHYSLWTWYESTIPFRNYGLRFILLFIFAAFFEKYPLMAKPRLGQTALICQILFFVWLRSQIR